MICTKEPKENIEWGESAPSGILNYYRITDLQRPMKSRTGSTYMKFFGLEIVPETMGRAEREADARVRADEHRERIAEGKKPKQETRSSLSRSTEDADPVSDNGNNGKKAGAHKKSRGHETKMDRITFRLPREKREKINSLVENDEYHNMSAALREAVDTLLFNQQ